MRLPRLATNPAAITAGALAGALAVGLMLASIFGWPTTVRLVMVAVVLAIAIILLVVKLVRAERNAKGIEQAMRAGGDRQRQASRPDRQGEIKQLQEQFDRALKTLKESKLTRGRRGSEALYALPWYLFVGPPAAGKTTAIQQSGLRFPLGTNRVRGVGGTRNCDWFFADSAILLDTAGRYMVEEEDAEEWHAFLKALKKHRKHQPINGVLAGMSVADLAQMSSAEVELHAEAFRQRLDELVRVLGVEYPVYLVFTKCDLLAGFVEFFGDLTKAERGQVWGASFEVDEGRPPVEAFTEEFDALMDVLQDERVARMARPMKREEGRAVFAFPLEVASLKERLALFVDQLFLPNPYQDSPRFRGFYFTSGTQEGAPIDRVISAIAEELGIAPEPAGAPRFDVETKSYFLSELFADVVIPDQHLVRQTRRPGRAFPVAAIAAAAGVLVFAVLLALSARRSVADIRRVETASATFAAQRIGGTPDQAVVEMDSLRAAVAEARRGPGWLYDRDGLLGPADAVWLRRARAFVDAHGVEVLEQRIGAAARGGLTGAAWQALYEDVQAYLLLSQEARRLAGDSARANRTLLRNHLLGLARRQGVGVADRAPLVRVYGGFADALGERRVEPFRADPHLVRRARAALARAPASELTYGRILRDGATRFEPVTPSSIAGGGGSVFAGEPRVPGVFTKAAWTSHVRPAIEAAAGRPAVSDWVVGHVRGLQLLSESESDVAAQLRRRYFDDYAAAWDRFLRALHYPPSRDPAAAAQRLKVLGDPMGSPLLLVLTRIAGETDFTRPSPASDTAIPEEGAPDAAVAAATAAPALPGVLPDEPLAPVERGAESVARRFRWLHALRPQLAASGGAAPELTATFVAMTDLGGSLERGGAEARLADYELAVGRLRMDEGVRRRLFESPAVSGVGALNAASAAAAAAAAADAAGAVNDAWAEVYRFFDQRLAKRYPFNAQSSEDARTDDVQELFHPQSGLLVPFLAHGGAGDPTPTAAAALRHARAISEALFGTGQLSLQFAFEPDTPTTEGPVPTVASYTLRALGQSKEYDMGNIREPLVVQWPIGRSGASLRVETRGPPLELAFDGEWALLRLLDRADVQPVPNTTQEYDVSWPFQGPGYVIRAEYLLTTPAAPDLVRSPARFFSLRLPPRLTR